MRDNAAHLVCALRNPKLDFSRVSVGTERATHIGCRELFVVSTQAAKA